MKIFAPSGPSERRSTVEATIRVLVPGPRRRMPWRPVIAVLVGVAISIASAVVIQLRTTPAVAYVTVPVARQDLVSSVTATGTVNPQNTIAVGTQVSGTIAELDVDYNSHVRKGQVLAKLDPTSFQASLAGARAQLAQAQDQSRAAGAGAAGAVAAIGSAQAAQRAAQATARAANATARTSDAAIAGAGSTVVKSQSAVAVAQQTLARDRTLLAQGYIAQSQFDTDDANLVAAQSALSAAQIAVEQARLGASASHSQAEATIAQTSAAAFATSGAQAQAANQAANAAASSDAIAIQRAIVQTAQTNLAYTIITSPVDGTVVARDVSVGQTVAASLQTPTLFSIAQNLSKMEVDLSVGEPDIGNVRAGETVAFSVLAYPNRTFTGRVSQVRINPTTTQNVVTYTTVVLVDNQDGTLLPGMTANATIETAKAPSALVVPLAALTYSPDVNRTPRRASSDTTATASSAGPWGATTANMTAAAVAGADGRVFTLRDGTLVRVAVHIVLTNGTQAALTPRDGATLTPADVVVTGDSRATGAMGASTGNRMPNDPLAGPAAGSMRGLR